MYIIKIILLDDVLKSDTLKYQRDVGVVVKSGMLKTLLKVASKGAKIFSPFEGNFSLITLGQFAILA